MTALRIFAVTHPGLVRGDHQDRVVVDGWTSSVPGARLELDLELDARAPVVVAVVDGMGGHAGGAFAASTAGPLLAEGLAGIHDAATSQRVLESVSDAVAELGDRHGTPDMGATTAAIVVGPGGVQIVNAGDCRVYRAVAGMLTQLTTDDRADRGGRTVVTQYLGGRPRVLDPHHVALDHAGRAVSYLLCSDGLTDAVGKDTLRAVLHDDAAPRLAVETLLDHALTAGGPDNVSIVVVQVMP